jgi:hypothetical protein
VGDPITLHVWRDGEVLNVGGTITLGKAEWRTGTFTDEVVAVAQEYRQQLKRLDGKLETFPKEYQ